MAIPRGLDILDIMGVPFFLVYKEDVKSDDGKIDLFGKICFVTHTIYIASKYIKQQQQYTLLHELFHGIEEFSAMKFSENQVRGLGVGMYNLLKNNKDFFIKYLQELV